MIIVGVLILGIIAGWNLRQFVAAWRVNQILKEYQDEAGRIKHPADKLIPITIEEHSGAYFVYDADGQFMVQANDRASLEASLMEKYPGKMFAVTPENLKQMGFN